jgi:hypothetical protein
MNQDGVRSQQDGDAGSLYTVLGVCLHGRSAGRHDP